jgi:hypothetical protein
MSEENMKSKSTNNINVATGSAGGFYFIGFIGAAVYFVSTAFNFWDGALGLVKAALWPGFLVYEALSILGA